MQIIFFIFLLLLLFPYFIFPLWMWLLTKNKPLSWRQQEISPAVTLIISVFNEEQVIGKKLENSLQLDYPQDKLEILVVSDGSTDKTHQIVESFGDPRIKLKIFTDRAGKTECLNRVVPEAQGEIIVFTDANSMYPADALQKITRNFADHAVGLVTGWTKYRAADGEEETTGLYAKLEMVTKHGESLVSSCVGADGAIFAIRKELFLPLKDYDINDFVIPLNIISQRRRVVLDPELFCFEEPSEGEIKEYRRQVRITNRTLGAIWRGRQLLNPNKYGFFSLLLLSHKVVRFLVPFFFIATLLIGISLAPESFLCTLVVAAQLIFIGLGVAGLFRWYEGRLVNLCSFFLLTISAQSVGWYRFATGKSDTVWTPQR